jgi:CRISPR-associated protein Csx10
MTQQILQLTVRLRSPLLVGDESGVGNYEQTADYIPGTVLRGAVGARLLQSCSQPGPSARRRDHAGCPDRDTCVFWRVFGAEHPPRFGHAYSTTRGQGFPFPATARTCKYNPGYRHSRTNPKGHGVFDTLVGQFVYDLVSDPRFLHRADLLPNLGTAWAALPAHYDPTCPDCAAPVQPATGYYLLDKETPGYTPQPTVSRATHVGINRARGVAEDALLFTLETIEPDPGGQSTFRARLIYDDAYADALNSALDLNGGTRDFFVGRGQSRGLGHVTLTTDPPPDHPGLHDRLLEFNAALRQALQRYHDHDDRIPEGLAGTCFSLTLRAPAILTSAGGTPALWPDLHPFKLGDAWALRAWARTTLVGGWDAAAGLPRATRQAVEPGAVYLFYVPPGVMEQQVLEDHLQELEQAGLGAERERGYGQVTVCAPFHYAGRRR